MGAEVRVQVDQPGRDELATGIDPLHGPVGPACRAAKYRGGACHLPRGHSGPHECNAVGGQLHRWR
jgi:hypothetical protein